MAGKIKYRADRNYYFVQWGNHKISRYKGILCREKELAVKLLAIMQADAENCIKNKTAFQIERYVEQRTSTAPYLREWFEAVKDTLSPATQKDYLNSINNHLIPWLRSNPHHLHEIQYDTLCKLLNDIKRDGKGKKNVLYCLRACMKFAHRSRRIDSVPAFPEKKKYNIVKKHLKGIPSVRQERIIRAIPECHQPIFWWLKYHYRRPSEACALFKEDYDAVRDAFIIRRTFSNKVLVDHTKTHTEHEIPCNPHFRPIMDKMPVTFGRFFFENPSRDCKTKKRGRHYTISGLEDIWNRACGVVGEKISLYPGTKHSACWQFLNEQGGTIDELQTLTDHASRESVTVYGEMEIEAKRRLMGKVLKISEPRLNQAKTGIASNGYDK